MRPQEVSVRVSAVKHGFIVEEGAYADRPTVYAFETLDTLLAFLRTYFAAAKTEQELEVRYDAERR